MNGRLLSAGLRHDDRPGGRLPFAVVAVACVAILAGCSAPGGSTPSQGGPSATDGAGSTAGATTPASPTTLATPSPTPVPTIPAAAIHAIDTGAGPNVLAMTSDRVWVELHREDTIASIDPVSSAVKTHSEVAAHCFIASDGKDTVWATIASRSTVTRVDARTGKPTLTVSVPDACGVGVSADQVWVTSPGAGTVLRLDPVTGKTLREVKAGDMPFVVSPLGGLVYASGEGRGGWVAAIDPKDGRVVASRTAPDIVFIDSFVLGFDSLWAVGRMDSRLLRLDPRTLKTVAEVEIGPQPSGVAIMDGAVWVTQLNSTLAWVDPTTNTVNGRWQVPHRFLVSPTPGFGRLWMAALESNVVMSVDPSKLPD